MSSLESFSPLDGQSLGRFQVSTAQEIVEQMQQARDAAQIWRELTVAQRLKKLAPLKNIILDQLEDLCQQLCLITGKVRTEALLGEIYPIVSLLTFYQKHAVRILREQVVETSSFAFPAATAQIERRAYGVVAVISPWNYPFQLSLAPILTALVAGNAVLLKVSELSLPVAPLIIKLLTQLDIPQDLVQYVVGEGKTGEQLIDAAPDLLFFTGGLATGRKVMQRAAQWPIPVILELGGKDAMLVFADAELQRARDGALFGGFCNSGQVCVSVERLYVQQSCYQDFIDMLLDGLAALKIGNDAYGDLGAIVSERQFEIIQTHYLDAIAQGAQVSGPLQRQGNYLMPVLLWNVHHGMLVMREESFGPLLPVMAFNDENDAISLANDSEFGLNASIWSRDIAKAQRVAAQLQVGNWVINDVLKNVGHPGLPFGGVKNSGFGRYHGAEGLRNFSYPVSGVINRSRLPKEPNWFPYSESRYQHFKGFMRFVYGRGSLLYRLQRNWSALQAFRQYSTIDLHQCWQNLQCLLPWKRDY